MSTTTPATIDSIKRILTSVKALPGAPADLPDDTDLIEGIGLDSIELLTFMLEVEAQLGIRIDFDRMEFSTLSSIATLSAFLDTMPKAESAA
ncbi:acyl carrier protein [Azospirillum agricola]|uniref:acyl carrier protein n=1 Tax=Azospirillum agricola TaxID=1720247 RepID=UPI000A0F1D4E|nr:acyl carrier protein [Azospirillum agricola]SMH41861.1 acyl carrier protein [Azospirillum lipoferum]